MTPKRYCVVTTGEDGTTAVIGLFTASTAAKWVRDNEEQYDDRMTVCVLERPE